MKEVITDIYINGAPDRVWQVLTSNEQWYAWNPFITESKGNFIAGQKVTNKLVMPGQKPMVLKPTILKADPERELRWLGRLFLPGIFDGEHYFQLKAEGQGTRFTHGETFRGLLIGVLDYEEVRKCFVAMNEALKKRVEG